MCRQMQSGWRQLAAYRTEGQTSASRKDNTQSSRPRQALWLPPPGRQDVDPIRSPRRHLSAASKTRLLALSFRDLVQTPNDIAQKEFVLEIHLIIEVRPQPIFLCLPILRHHDDGRLQREDHIERKVEQNVGKRIKSLIQ